MICEMCGKQGNLVIAMIEGTELKVCKDCAKFGKILREIKPKPTELKETRLKQIQEEEQEPIQIIVDDFAKLIKNKRESLGINQKDFAKKINEKISLIHNLESGKFTPGISLAKKLEKALGIKLVEEYEEKHEKIKTEPADSLTIGDIIRLKKH